MRQEHIAKVSGKDYVTYDGLISEAYERGLVSMDVLLLQAPGPDNNFTAICKATVVVRPLATSEQYSGTDVITASDLGDANADNVGAKIIPHIIRMASTRAKSRALSDAMGITGTSAEELVSAAPSPKADARSIEAIQRGYRALDLPVSDDLNTLTQVEADALISSLVSRVKAKKAKEEAATPMDATPAAAPVADPALLESIRRGFKAVGFTEPEGLHAYSQAQAEALLAELTATYNDQQAAAAVAAAEVQVAPAKGKAAKNGVTV